MSVQSQKVKKGSAETHAVRKKRVLNQITALHITVLLLDTKSLMMDRITSVHY